MMSEIEDVVMVKPSNHVKQVKMMPRECLHSKTSKQVVHENFAFKIAHSLQNNDLIAMSELEELVLDVPDINHAHVEHLKKEISSGRYQISSNQIARRMLSNF